MSLRPLVFVTGITAGDYVLWSWSLSGSHAVLALVSGLTLPPLAVASLWLLALSAARLVARQARRPRATRSVRSSCGRRRRSTSRADEPGSRVPVASERASQPAAHSPTPSRKLAA